MSYEKSKSKQNAEKLVYDFPAFGYNSIDIPVVQCFRTNSKTDIDHHLRKNESSQW